MVIFAMVIRSMYAPFLFSLFLCACPSNPGASHDPGELLLQGHEVGRVQGVDVVFPRDPGEFRHLLRGDPDVVAEPVDAGRDIELPFEGWVLGRHPGRAAARVADPVLLAVHGDHGRGPDVHGVGSQGEALGEVRGGPQSPAADEGDPLAQSQGAEEAVGPGESRDEGDAHVLPHRELRRPRPAAEAIEGDEVRPCPGEVGDVILDIPAPDLRAHRDATRQGLEPGDLPPDLPDVPHVRVAGRRVRGLALLQPPDPGDVRGDFLCRKVAPLARVCPLPEPDLHGCRLPELLIGDPEPPGRVLHNEGGGRRGQFLVEDAPLAGIEPESEPRRGTGDGELQVPRDGPVAHPGDEDGGGEGEGTGRAGAKGYPRGDRVLTVEGEPVNLGRDEVEIIEGEGHPFLRTHGDGDAFPRVRDGLDTDDRCIGGITLRGSLLSHPVTGLPQRLLVAEVEGFEVVLIVHRAPGADAAQGFYPACARPGAAVEYFPPAGPSGETRALGADARAPVLGCIGNLHDRISLPALPLKLPLSPCESGYQPGSCGPTETTRMGNPVSSQRARLVQVTQTLFPFEVTFSFRFFRNCPGEESSSCIIWSRSRPELSVAGTMVPMAFFPMISSLRKPKTSSARRLKKVMFPSRSMVRMMLPEVSTRVRYRASDRESRPVECRMSRNRRRAAMARKAQSFQAKRVVYSGSRTSAGSRTCMERFQMTPNRRKMRQMATGP